MCVRVKHCHSLHVVLGSTTESESEKWEKSTLVPDLEDYLTVRSFTSLLGVRFDSKV